MTDRRRPHRDDDPTEQLRDWRRWRTDTVEFEPVRADVPLAPAEDLPSRRRVPKKGLVIAAGLVVAAGVIGGAVGLASPGERGGSTGGSGTGAEAVSTSTSPSAPIPSATSSTRSREATPQRRKERPARPPKVGPAPAGAHSRPAPPAGAPTDGPAAPPAP